MTVAGVRRRHQIDGFDFAEFPKQLDEMLGQLPGLTARVGDRVYDIFWGMFTDLGGYFEYLVGVEVGDDFVLPDGYAALVLPAQRYVVVANRLDDSPRDTVFTLWHEWLPAASGVEHPGGNTPEFIYQHGEDYREEERNGTLDVCVPVRT